MASYMTRMNPLSVTVYALPSFFSRHVTLWICLSWHPTTLDFSQHLGFIFFHRCVRWNDFLTRPSSLFVCRPLSLGNCLRTWTWFSTTRLFKCSNNLNSHPILRMDVPLQGLVHRPTKCKVLGVTNGMLNSDIGNDSITVSKQDRLGTVLATFSHWEFNGNRLSYCGMFC